MNKKTKPFAESFPFVISEKTKLLILGTMPGQLSIFHQQYYAHPRNNFWKIIYAAHNLEVERVYEKRLEFLLSKELGLWDALQYCERKGSLDSNIKNERPNAFNDLFMQFPNICAIAFNGKSAYNYFKKHFGLETGHEYFILPSTSPANSTKNFELKLKEWREVLLKNYSR